MSIIEANITLDLKDGEDPSRIISLIKQMVSKLNGKETYINITEVDDPLSLSPLSMKKLEE
jgi:hypothetical protein